MDPQKTDTSAKAATPADATSPRRKRLMLALSGVFAATGIAWGTYWGLVARHVEKTDDAYVAGNVLAIHADDTDFVRSGESLVELDQADAKLALDQAQAQLAQTVREVRTLFATSNALSATTRLREADVAKARDDR